MDLAFANHPLFHLRPAGLELRLHQGEHHPIRPHQAGKPWEDEAQRDEGNVDGDEIYFLPDVLEAKITGVEPLLHHHPRIVPELPVQKAAAHVHGVDLSSPVLEETIGEPPSGCADIQANLSRGIDPEGLERGRQFFPAPGDIARGREELNMRRRGNRRTGLVHKNPVHPDLPGQDQSLGFGPGGSEAPFHKNEVQPPFPLHPLVLARASL